MSAADERKDPSVLFQLLEKLGEGSYGAVYKALHRPTGNIVAVKKVPVESDLDDIIKEINIMKSCDSPYIVSYYGSYFKDTDLWIVMELCGGGSVADLLSHCKKPLTEAQIAVVCRDILKGLEYLHKMRKIHRDVKAGNILLTTKGDIKLADFGVSGQLSDTMAKRMTLIGTPFWMAPEVIQETGYDVKADIWSLGITAIEMAESKPPYADIHPMRAIFLIPARPPPTLSKPDSYSSDFTDFVARCLTKKPDDRPSASELLKHPFITKARTSTELVPLIDEYLDIIERRGRNFGEDADADKAAAIAKVKDEAGETATTVYSPARVKAGDSSDGGVTTNATGTMEHRPVAPDPPSGMGTVKHTESSSGSVRQKSGGENYSPPFMALLKKADSSKAPKDLKDFGAYSVGELKSLLATIESQMHKEMEDIRSKYSKRKQPIISVLTEKKQGGGASATVGE